MAAGSITLATTRRFFDNGKLSRQRWKHALDEIGASIRELTRQTGLAGFRIADPMRDAALLPECRTAVLPNIPFAPPDHPLPPADSATQVAPWEETR